MRKTWSVIKKILFFVGGLLIWIEFAYTTLYRDEWALNATGGNPMPNEWTFLLLPVMLSIVFHEGFTKKGFWGVAFKILIGLLLLIGVLFFIMTISSKPK